AKSPTKIN
ncbi:hypothetical protein VCHC59A1_0108B, partial [Vibrio cholerae HC-59A1]